MLGFPKLNFYTFLFINPLLKNFTSYINIKVFQRSQITLDGHIPWDNIFKYTGYSTNCYREKLITVSNLNIFFLLIIPPPTCTCVVVYYASNLSILTSFISKSCHHKKNSTANILIFVSNLVIIKSEKRQYFNPQLFFISLLKKMTDSQVFWDNMIYIWIIL